MPDTSQKNIWDTTTWEEVHAICRNNKDPDFRSACIEHFFENYQKFLTNWWGIYLACSDFPEAKPRIFKFVMDNDNYFLERWGDIDLVISYFPEAKPKIFEFVMGNAAFFLNDWSDIGWAIKKFPAFEAKIFKLVIDDANGFLKDWWAIDCAISNFPAYKWQVRNFLFEKSDRFLINDSDIETARDKFPEDAEIWAKGSLADVKAAVKAAPLRTGHVRLVSNGDDNYFLMFKPAVKLDLPSAEVKVEVTSGPSFRKG